MILKKYKKEDAKTVIGWIQDETAFHLWCAGRFKHYPLSAEEFNNVYESDPDMNGFIAWDGDTAVGHFFAKMLTKDTCKLGLIIIDSTKRGMGYGKTMVSMALETAKTFFGAKKVTLSVFDTNISATKCYEKLGFKKTSDYSEINLFGKTEKYYKMEYSF